MPRQKLHFEQVPVEVVKNILEHEDGSDEPGVESSKNAVVERLPKKTEPYVTPRS